ncbi:ABC transporter transmembrane domain-containing protein, partial [Thioalkalivibrio sp. HK1]|uniref:ABC transporter transmembrane domain-containing protein n=1 Tax=Thioalkalivibrio sp. HK1 TaxID=1469245 RepID=UPI0004728147
MFLEPRLWEFTCGVRLRIAGAVATGVAASLVGIGRLALLGWLLALVFEGAGFSDLALPFAAVAAVMVLRGTLEHARTMIAHRTAAKVQLVLRRRLHDKLIALGPAHFGFERTGDVLLSLVDGVEQLEIYFGEYLPQLMVAVITPLLVFAFLAFLDLPIAALLLAFAALALLAPSLFHRWDAANSKRRSVAWRGFAAELLDALQGIATLKAFGQSGARGEMLAKRAHEVFRSTMWVLATNALTRGISDTAIAVGSAALIGFGALRVSQGLMDTTTLLIVLMTGIEVFRPQRDLRAMLHNGMTGQAAALGILSILEAKAKVEPPAAPVVLDGALEPSIEFEDISFAYPGGRRLAHQGLSFRIDAGERVGFVGESGAGKSTIVRLLLRFHDPDKGRVRLGGHDLRTLSPADIHRHIAVVGQDVRLFHATVEENLRFGNPDAGPEEIEAAARAANAWDFIRRLPQGMQTIVGERGIRLSGGQRQRIAIARALLKNAPILILDEALSAVDAQNEALIVQALDRLMIGRTTLIFAHRLSSVIATDRIAVLERGTIIESGRHEDLMRNRGTYFRLMGTQAEDSDLDAAPNDRPDPLDSGETSAISSASETQADPSPPERNPSSMPDRSALRGVSAERRYRESSSFALDDEIEAGDYRGSPQPPTEDPGTDETGTRPPLSETEAPDRHEPLSPPTEDPDPDEADIQPPISEAVLRARDLGWAGAFRALLAHVTPWKGRLLLVLLLGLARVAALIGIGVMSALAVAAVKQGQPWMEPLIILAIIAPLAGILHWLESWLAHDMAFRMLADMRIALYRKIDRLAPAWLVRRHSGDLVATATGDVELVEYFFAHTVAPFFVAVLVPAAVIGTLWHFGMPLALALLPFLALVAISPFLARRRIDIRGSLAREAFGEMHIHAVDTIQGLAEIISFERAGSRAEAFAALNRHHHRLRLSFFSDLAKQKAILEVATGLGGLVVIMVGAWQVEAGALKDTALPMLTLLAMAAFLPISEIAHIGRQLAETLGATRRLHAVHNEVETVQDGAGAKPTFEASPATPMHRAQGQASTASQADNEDKALESAIERERSIDIDNE